MIDDAARGAALATGTTVELTVMESIGMGLLWDL
ncbi:MAG: hypothetical protein Ct9H300mP15_12170 [Gemmatimonadota bacterium]|nr:MAG: hypothetical protein Ct9H300mP15_12170 [Gemmatimonadota bacterium]